MFVIFTFNQGDIDLWANSIVAFISRVMYASSPTSESQELPGLGLTGKITEKPMCSFQSSSKNTVGPTEEQDSGQYWFSVSTEVWAERPKGAEKKPWHVAIFLLGR